MVRITPDDYSQRSMLPLGPSNAWHAVANATTSTPPATLLPCFNLTATEVLFNFSLETVCALLAERRQRHVLDGKWQAAVIAGYASLIAVGIVSNVLVCCVVARQSMHRASHLGGRSRNLYILNLALADLALCCICMPLTVHHLLHFHWSMGVLLCKLAPVLQAANMLVSAGTISAIAVDRYNTIVRSPRGRGSVVRDTRAATSAASGLVIMWLLSLLVTSPLFFYTTLDSVSFNGVHLYDSCVEHWPSDSLKLTFSAGMTAVQFIIPVCILSCIHFKISAFLQLHLRPFQRPKIEIHSPLDPRNENNFKIATDDDTLIDEKRPLQKEFLNINRKESICSDNSQRSDSSRKYSDCSDSKRYSTPDISPRKRKDFLSSFRENSDFSFSFSKLSRETSKKSPKRVRRELRRNRRTTLLLACIACVYAASWLPYHAYNITTHAAPFLAEPATLYKAFAASHLLAMTSVCVNPFLYGWLNTNFRREFLLIFGALSSCFSKLFKKSSKLMNQNEAMFIKGGCEDGLKKKSTALSFIPTRKQDCVVVALFPDSQHQPNANV